LDEEDAFNSEKVPEISKCKVVEHWEDEITNESLGWWSSTEKMTKHIIA
jgi:hypothetical protein